MSVAIAGGTKIEWADLTFNPWQGCEKVSPACAHCYAEKQAARFTRGLWGAGHGYRFASEAYWRKPFGWARTAPAKLGRRPRVFCASMADVFEDRPELVEPRKRLVDLICATPELDWLILTKRPEFARDWWHWWRHDQTYPESPFEAITIPANVWMGVSIENSRYTWRADLLREIPAAVRFISAEPLLGSLFDPGPPIPATADPAWRKTPRRTPLNLDGIDWLIIGGESGPRARRTDPEWIAELLYRRDNDGTALFVKQLGKILGRELGCTDPKGGQIDEWPDWLQIREFPR